MASNNPNPRNSSHPQRAPNNFPLNLNFIPHLNFPMYMQNAGNLFNPNFPIHPNQINRNNSHPNQNSIPHPYAQFHMQNTGNLFNQNFPHYPNQMNPSNFSPNQNYFYHPNFQMHMQYNMENRSNIPQYPNPTYPNNFQPNQYCFSHPNIQMHMQYNMGYRSHFPQYPIPTNPNNFQFNRNYPQYQQQIPRAANNPKIVSSQNVAVPRSSETGSNTSPNSMSEQSEMTDPVKLPFTDPRRLRHEIQEINKQMKVYENLLENDNFSYSSSDSDSDSSSSSSSSSGFFKSMFSSKGCGSSSVFKPKMLISKKRSRLIERRVRKRRKINRKLENLIVEGGIFHATLLVMDMFSPTTSSSSTSTSTTTTTAATTSTTPKTKECD